MSRRSELLDKCHHFGFTFDTWSPGDGVTRYRFFSGTDPVDYFGGQTGESYGCYTALGFAEAVTYVRGRVDGIAQGTRDSERCAICGDPLYGLMRVHHHNDPETGVTA